MIRSKIDSKRDVKNQEDNDQFYLVTDPDLQTDVAIELPKDNHTAARTTMSGKSRKTIHSDRQSECRENIVRSRGRPIKPHETEPFLAIDNLPPEKSFVSEKSTLTTHTVQSRTSNVTPRQPSAGSRSLEAQLQRMRAYMSPYDKKTPAPPRSVGSRTGRITPANTPYKSPNKTERSPNFHVKSPFKHSVNQPDLSPDGRETPSMGMKERTALAAFHVHKMLSVAGEKDVHKTKGKLKKGKLKPLYPVEVEGPKIAHCRGIVSDTRSYQPSPSRTLQRRINLINKIPNVHQYLYERPGTVESVHRTSVASSIDDLEQIDANRNLPDEILYTENSVLAPENTFLPEPTQEEIVQRIQAMSVDPTPRMFATEISSRNVDPDDTPARQVEIHVTESGQNLEETEDTISAYSNSNAIDPCDADGRNRMGSPSKSVRFVEGNRRAAAESQNSKEVKQMVNESIARQQQDHLEARNIGDVINAEDIDETVIETVSRKNKQNSQTTCKPSDSEAIFRKDDDSDNEGDRHFKDDNRNADSNLSATQLSNGQGNSSNGENKSSGNTKTDNQGNKQSKDSGERKARERHRSSSSARSRSLSKDGKTDKKWEKNLDTTAAKSQIHKNRPDSAKSEKSRPRETTCSKFKKSKASLNRAQTLEVSSVLHGNSVITSLRPETPRKSSSRPTTPSQHRELVFNFFSNKPCFETCDSMGGYEHSHKSRVKFELEWDEPEMETIFIEDEDEVKVKKDKEITYDVLDSEIEMLRLAVQKSLMNHTQQTIASAGNNDEQESSWNKSGTAESDGESESGSDTTVTQANTINTIRGDYSNILEMYRQRCMERSENYGAISSVLVTPRETQSNASTRSRSQMHCSRIRCSDVKRGTRNDDGTSQTSIDHNKQTMNAGLLSDSGHGSFDNLSDLSRSVSQARFEVPRLDLDCSTSDLGLDSGRSEVTVTNGDGEVRDEEPQGERILEIVCEELSQYQPPQKPKERREILRQVMLEGRLKRDEDVSNLKVIATTKSLSKNSKRKPEVPSGPQALFPPLCFTINARPPQGYLYYFAYGPDMNPSRFGSYIKREIQHRYWALLFGFNLVFNKRGTSEEAGGFANLEFNPLRSVEGCLYKITPEELHVLDKAVGYPEHYQHLVLPVWMSNSNDPDGLGVAQYCVPALMYIAQNKWTQTDGRLNCDYALSQCIKSADLVTSEYRQSLVTMTTQQPVSTSA